MTDDQRQARNARLLAECAPVMRARMVEILGALEAQGWRPRIQQAWRSPAAQQALYRAGRTWVRWSFHNATTSSGAPDALACDVLDDDDATDDGQPNLSRGVGFVFALARAAQRVRCRTGLDWGLPAHMRRALWLAVEADDRSWPRLKLGRDPYHVEVADLTLAEARQGLRPRVGGVEPDDPSPRSGAPRGA